MTLKKLSVLIKLICVSMMLPLASHAIPEPSIDNTILFYTESSTLLNLPSTSSITLDVDHPYGVGLNGSSIILNNNGSILGTGESEVGIAISCNCPSQCGFITINNSGNINLSGDYTTGINTNGINAFVNNTGTIATTLYGMMALGQASTLINSGNITLLVNDSGTGMYTEVETVSMYNTGTISISGGSSAGIYRNNAGAQSITENTGSIILSGSSSYGMYAAGSSPTTVSNTGIISIFGEGSRGLGAQAGGSYLNNSGHITVAGDNSSAIYTPNDGSTIINSGTLSVTGSDSAAIRVLGDNNKVVLKRGSRTTGDIFTFGTGNTLYLDLGPGASYAYTTTGDWAVQDLDHRAFVTGSAYAAGIGAQEAAPEFLHERVRSITTTLDRRLQQALMTHTQTIGPWLDIYDSEISRSEGGPETVRSQFSSFNKGATIGFVHPISTIEILLNYEHNHVNIDQGNQRVKTEGMIFGLFAPSLGQAYGIHFSGKALYGYGKHKGDRRVYTNDINLSTTGSFNVTSNYSSKYGVIGGQMLKAYILNNHTTFHLLAGLDMVRQQTSSYSESAYYQWDARALTQAQSRIEAGLEGEYENFHPFLRMGLARWDTLGGKIQNYSINLTHADFSGSKTNDTSLTFKLGLNYQLMARINLFALVSQEHSSEQVNRLQGNLGAEVVF